MASEQHQTTDSPEGAPVVEEEQIEGIAEGGEAEGLPVDEAVPEAGPAAFKRMEAELETLQDQVIRRAAEFQNYRRRTEQEKNQLAGYVRGQVMESLLDVYDDLRRSLEATEQVDEQDPAKALLAYQALKQGVELVYRKFTEEMTRLGVAPIEAVGHPFSETEHEALMQQPAPEGTPEGTVLAEVQKGYRMGDRVLRHTKVIVAA